MNYSTPHHPFEVVIAGGGVAGLECGLALRELAGDSVAITMVAPEHDFVYRPLSIDASFAHQPVRHYSLPEIAADVGFELRNDRFAWLEPVRRVVHTDGGDALGYDAFVLALGANRYERFRHTLTLDDRRLDAQVGALLAAIDAGEVRSLALVIPSRVPWPLPVYELALMTAAHAAESGADLSITVATPEPEPLSVFGAPASEAVRRRLAAAGIELVTSAHCDIRTAGVVSIRPGLRAIPVDRVIALPELCGPPTPGVPGGARAGFIPVDRSCRVRRLERVYAAGDATDCPVKHGGIAAQQADTVAQAIAALAGCGEPPPPFAPTLRAILLGGERPLYLSSRLTGGHGSYSHVSETPLWPPEDKIVAQYLGPYLRAHDELRVG